MRLTLDVAGLGKEQRPTAIWAAALLHGLAREELAGRKPARLTEPGLATWNRFRGRLTANDFLGILFEDAAVLHSFPFDPEQVGEALQLDCLPHSLTQGWLQSLETLDLQAPSADYIEAQARLLFLPTRLARSDLHVVKPHQRVLELPGTGGQLCHHLVSTQTDLNLQDNFTVACGSWQELTLAGLIALDLAAPDVEFAKRVDLPDLRHADHELRRKSFDFVIGLHPDKGGLYRVEDQLAIWFSGAKILL